MTVQECNLSKWKAKTDYTWMDKPTQLKETQGRAHFILYQFTTHFILESQTDVLKGNSTKTLKSDVYKSINPKHTTDVFMIFNSIPDTKVLSV